MRLGNKTLDTITNLSANSTASIELPRDRFVKEVDLFVTLNIKNNAGSGSVSITESQIISLIKRIRVVVNGRDTLVDVNAFRKFLMDWFTFNTKTYTNIPSSISAGATATCEFEIPIVFAVNPVVEWDLSAIVPAHLTSSFYVYVDVGSPGDINSNLQLTSGTIRTNVKELYCTAQEERQILSNLRKVYEIELAKAIDTTYSNYMYSVDLDVGNIIQKIGIFAYGSTGALSDSVISDYMIKQDSPIDVILEKISWKQSKAEDKRIYDMEEVPIGITVYDAEFKIGGLDTRGLKSGDVKFKANTISTGQVVLYHREIA